MWQIKLGIVVVFFDIFYIYLLITYHNHSSSSFVVIGTEWNVNCRDISVTVMKEVVWWGFRHLFLVFVY